MISIILPTYNESDHLPHLLRQIFEVTGNNRIQVEVIVVDDNSPDGTGELAYYLKKFFPHLRTLHRDQRYSKTSAILDGLTHARGNIIGTMPANLSCPPQLIPNLLLPLISGNIDITIGSRFLQDSHISHMSPIAKFSHRFGKLGFLPLTSVHDPMSDYFFFRREILNKIDLDPTSPHLLPELLIKSHFSAAQEISFAYDHPQKKLALNPLKTIGHLWHLTKLYKVHFLN
jgi:dolichol-phosphate mannosyltransferase